MSASQTFIQQYCSRHDLDKDVKVHVADVWKSFMCGVGAQARCPGSQLRPAPIEFNLWFTQCIIIDFLSTHADRQGVDISATVCLCICVCVFVRLRIFPPRIKLVASNFERRFIGVLVRGSPILGNYAPPDAQNWTNRSLACGPSLTDVTATFY